MEKRIREAYLISISPRSAWYSLAVVEIALSRRGKAYIVIKRSGIEEGKCLHQQEYFLRKLDLAIDFYEKKLAEKLNPKRKNPRKYRLLKQNSVPVQSALFGDR